MDIKIANTIAQVQAVEIDNGFRIEVVFKNGDIEIIKKKSTRKPPMVQLYQVNYVNGNYRGVGIGGHFTFNKKIDSYFKESHLKSFVVA